MNLTETLVTARVRDEENKNGNSTPCQCLVGAIASSAWGHLVLMTAL